MHISHLPLQRPWESWVGNTQTRLTLLSYPPKQKYGEQRPSLTQPYTQKTHGRCRTHPGNGSEFFPPPGKRVEVVSTHEQPNGKVNRQVLEKLQMVTTMWENWYLGISSPHHPTSNPSPGPAYIKPEVSLQLVPFFNLLTISNATTLVHTTSSVGSPVCFRCPLWSHTCWLQVSSATNSLCTWRLKS